MNIEIISTSQSTNYLVRYNGEEYRVTVWEKGSKWIDWEIVFNADHDKEISHDLEEEIMETLEQFLIA